MVTQSNLFSVKHYRQAWKFIRTDENIQQCDFLQEIHQNRKKGKINPIVEINMFRVHHIEHVLQ